MNETYDIMRLSNELERALLGPEGKRVIDDTPWLTLPPGYSFKVTFPFNGAAARFRVCKTEQPQRDISVYLDTQYVLGYFGSPLESAVPYWEAYPIGDEVARFALTETTALIEAIVAELGQPTREAETAPGGSGHNN